MGMWKGLLQGYQMAGEKKERELEREERQQMFLQGIEEKRRDTLLQLMAQRQSSTENVGQYLGAAQALANRFEGVDDPRVAAVLSDPKTAAELEAKLSEIEKIRAEQDLNLPPLRGEAALETFTVFDPKTNSVRVVEYSTADLLKLNAGDDAAYEEAFLNLSRPESQQRPYVQISPEVYRRPDPQSLEVGREAFDQEVLRLANAERSKVKDDPGASSYWTNLIENYKEENSEQRMELRDKLGAQAIQSLLAQQNPYIQNLEQDPLLNRYVQTGRQIKILNDIINDPNASEEDRARAAQYLAQLQG